MVRIERFDRHVCLEIDRINVWPHGLRDWAMRGNQFLSDVGRAGVFPAIKTKADMPVFGGAGIDQP